MLSEIDIMDQSGVKPWINGRYDLEKLNRRITLCLEHIVTVGLEYLQMYINAY